MECREFSKGYLDCAFVRRNNRSITPVEGINFTPETLTYMTPPARADEITNIIVERMKSKGFHIYECCGGIGGNTVSFLDSPSVGKVITYERDPQRFEILKNNVYAYGFENKWQGFNKEFDLVSGDLNNAIGSVVYFDPPWLPENISGIEGTKEEYILEGMRVGQYTLEEWLALLRHCPMVVMRLPPGYRMKEVEGFKKIQVKDFKKADLLIFESKLGFQRIVDSYFANIPIAPIEPVYQDWAENLRRSLYNYMEKIVPNPIERLVFFGPNEMKIWYLAFTHESVDWYQNYERLEFLGDSVLSAELASIMYELFPEYTEGQLSQLDKAFTNKKKLAEISSREGLNRLIRLPKEVPAQYAKSIDIKEDVVESFVGALYKIADSIDPRYAHLIMNKYIRILFPKTELIGTAPEETEISQVKQYFEGFGWGQFRRIKGTHKTSNILEDLARPEVLNTISQQDQNVILSYLQRFPSTEVGKRALSNNLNRFVKVVQYPINTAIPGRFMHKYEMEITPEGVAFLQNQPGRLARLTNIPRGQSFRLADATAESENAAYKLAFQQAYQTFKANGIDTAYVLSIKEISLRRELGAEIGTAGGESFLVRALLATIHSDVSPDYTFFDFYTPKGLGIVQLYAISNDPKTKKEKRRKLLYTNYIDRTDDKSARRDTVLKYLQQAGTERLVDILPRFISQNKVLRITPPTQVGDKVQITLYEFTPGVGEKFVATVEELASNFNYQTAAQMRRRLLQNI